MTSEAIDGIHQAAEQRAQGNQIRREAVLEIRRLARQAWSEGTSVSEIAAAAGLSRQAVYDMLRGLPRS